jgi:universal stress protein E
VTTEIRLGKPHLELIRAAVERRADLVVVSDEPSRRGGRAAFGTVTMNLLRACPTPVWASRTASPGRVRRVMAAIDIDDDPALNREILELADLLARAKDAQLYVVHAWALWGEHLLRGYGGMNAPEVDQLLADRRGEAAAEIQRLLDARGEGARSAEVVIVKGDPRRIIPAAAREHHADLVVMGTVARTGIPGFIIGNTAEKVLNELDCSVVTVKPEGFVSAVAGRREPTAPTAPAPG